ncbi:AaceriADR261Cp [[Ashbya] aceris (nom. inval.)]|nr:AaceriADR261Cp [[Ashbya] aceris (nom. inval.)]
MEVNQTSSGAGGGSGGMAGERTGTAVDGGLVDPTLSLGPTLPANKEVRIQLALQYFRQQQRGNVPLEADGAATNAAVNGLRPKQSLRQIAMFFQIPKSTLYDRLKNSAKKQRAVVPAKVVPPSKTRATVASSPSNVSHLIQMKLDPTVEERLFLYLRKVCLAYGNLPNLVQLKFLVSQEIKHITLGRKWVSNFIKRHSERIIYGWDVFHNPIKFEDFKKWKNQFTFLWVWFVPMLQGMLRKCMDNGDDVYYLVRVPISYEMLASCFICFKIEPELRLTLAFEPVVVTFRHNNTNMMHKEARIKTLNNTLYKCYQQIPSSAKLVIFEGFNDQYRWDFEDCIRLINPDNFVSLPWDRHILTKLIEFGPELVRMDDPNTVKLSWNETHFRLQDIANELKLFMAQSNEAIASDVNLPALPDQTEESADAGTRAIDIELHGSTSIDDGDSPDDDEDADSAAADVAVAILGHSPPLQRTPSTERASADPQTMHAQLKALVATIDDHEPQLYNNMADPASKVLLNNIFNRLRAMVSDDAS